MSKQKAHKQQKPKKHERKARRHRQALISLVLCLSVAGIITAQLRVLPTSATHPSLASALPEPQASQTPQLSKEYIYAGGRLIATEEPQGTNAAPSVTLTAPANGSSLLAPTTINLEATASDTDGTITKVEFYQGTTKLGEDTTAPYGFIWNNVAAGNYTLMAKATDNSNNSTTSSVVNITVGSGTTENVVWTNDLNVLATGNSLIRTAQTNAWDGGASSTKALASGNGYVEFTVSDGGYRMCGLSNGDTDKGYGDIDFALYPSANGTLNVYEGGIWIPEASTTYAVGDTFRISIDNGAVKYWHKGSLIYTSKIAPTYPLRVDSSLYTPNSTINNAVISGNLMQVANGAENVTWTNPIKVEPLANSSNSLIRTDQTNAWDGGASSTKAIASGNGYVEFTAMGGGYRMCGLSSGTDANQNYAEINYTIFLSDNGTLNVYEGELWRGSFGTYTSGDVLRVEVEGQAIEYKKNGVIFYTHAITPSNSLRVDTSLYTPNSTINNVKIWGTLTP